ncbi:MAG: outer membrane beta-barrel protein, partial [Prevotella sp.]|nr:outer membrane beta-barrel protein [Prevotella sp.]
MFKFKQLTAIAALALAVCTNAFAQKAETLDYKPAPYMFVGLQAGGQTTFTNYDQLKLITPTASVSFGAFFTPVVGARLHVNGIFNKGGINPGGFTYDYNYATTDLDLMLNLCTMFGRQDYYPLNVYLIGGIGLNYAWNNDDLLGSTYYMPFAWKDNRLSHNARVGAMLDYNIAKHWSVNLEVNANSLSDRYNSKVCAKDDWQLTAQIGVMYKFGFKKKTITAPVAVTPVQE